MNTALEAKTQHNTHNAYDEVFRTRTQSTHGKLNKDTECTDMDPDVLPGNQDIFFTN